LQNCLNWSSVYERGISVEFENQPDLTPVIPNPQKWNWLMAYSWSG